MSSDPRTTQPYRLRRTIWCECEVCEMAGHHDRLQRGEVIHVYDCGCDEHVEVLFDDGSAPWELTRADLARLCVALKKAPV